MTRLFDDIPETPEEGWPWLLEHCPQIFDGIDVSKEPYAQYLKGNVAKPTQAQNGARMNDVIEFAVFMLKDIDFSLADISEALTGKREYGGAIYTRVKAVRDYFKNTTTELEYIDLDEFERMAA